MFGDIAFALRTVLRSPERLRALFSGGTSTTVGLLRFMTRIVPISAANLAAIRERAAAIPDARLRAQALASVDGKAYHVAGACILATFLEPPAARAYVSIVAPLETIYDYLDNLCDRHPEVSVDAYPVLHQAIADALDPSATVHDYYARGPAGDDGGYLRDLVERTQRALSRVPHLDVLAPRFAHAAQLYGEMQTYKHYPPGEREQRCVAWYEQHRDQYRDIDWHEFASAAGSQFHVYGPLFEAFLDRRDAIAGTYDAYFPYVSALHVLLDAFIDQAEDREHGELNFSRVYGGTAALRTRVHRLIDAARSRLRALPGDRAHSFVLDVMTLFYLSHPKIAAQGLEREARALLRTNASPPREVHHGGPRR
jgi:tetraprenyl-beta-curcumene synthase